MVGASLSLLTTLSRSPHRSGCRPGLCDRTLHAVQELLRPHRVLRAWERGCSKSARVWQG
eukprot:11301062-Alexandrium_andersonii.AAC.1